MMNQHRLDGILFHPAHVDSFALVACSTSLINNRSSSYFVFCNRLLTHIVFIEFSEFPMRIHLAAMFPGRHYGFLLGFFVWLFFGGGFRLWRLYIFLIIKSFVLSLVPCYFSFLTKILVFIFIQPKPSVFDSSAGQWSPPPPAPGGPEQPATTSQCRSWTSWPEACPAYPNRPEATCQCCWAPQRQCRQRRWSAASSACDKERTQRQNAFRLRLL